MKQIHLLPLTLLAFTAALMAENNETSDLKDMSDPLAVYTRAGIGVTNKGFNIKIGIQYKSDDSDKNVMNVYEIKGFEGDFIGWDGDYKRSNSVDSIRYRNFSVDTTNGRGTQIDITYDFHSDAGIASYSLLQGLPKWRNFNIYPLLGLGVSFAKNTIQDDGTIRNSYSIPGALAVVGLYGKYTVNDKIWLNYNPFWSVGLTGTDHFMDHGFEGDSSVLTHEASVGYKLTPRSNIRYYANWSENIDFDDGVHRIEFNYQF